MNKEGIVIPKEIAAHVDRVKLYNTRCIESFGDHMGYAFLCGAELMALKETVKHGDFTALKKEHFPEMSNGRIGRYMAFAEKLQAKFPMMGNLKVDQLQLTNGEIPEKDKTQILKAVHEAADGKTLTQLYRDLGVIREKKAPKHHPKKDKKLSPEEELEQRKQAVAQDWGAMELHWEHNLDFILLDDLAVNSQIAFLQKLITARKQWVNAPKAKRDAKAIEKILKGK